MFLLQYCRLQDYWHFMRRSRMMDPIPDLEIKFGILDSSVPNDCYNEFFGMFHFPRQDILNLLFKIDLELIDRT
jgi:hypothetical protein